MSLFKLTYFVLTVDAQRRYGMHFISVAWHLKTTVLRFLNLRKPDRHFGSMRSLSSGRLDHIPADIVRELAPGLSEHQQRIALEPGVVAYHESRANPVSK